MIFLHFFVSFFIFNSPRDRTYFNDLSKIRFIEIFVNDSIKLFIQICRWEIQFFISLSILMLQVILLLVFGNWILSSIDVQFKIYGGLKDMAISFVVIYWTRMGNFQSKRSCSYEIGHSRLLDSQFSHQTWPANFTAIKKLKLPQEIFAHQQRIAKIKKISFLHSISSQV